MGNHLPPPPPQALNPLSHPQVSWAVPSLIFNLFAADRMELGPMPPLQLPGSRAGTWRGWAPLPSPNTFIPFPASPMGPQKLRLLPALCWGRLPASLDQAVPSFRASLTPYPATSSIGINFTLTTTGTRFPFCGGDGLAKTWGAGDGGRRLSPCTTLQLAGLPAARPSNPSPLGKA